jgi:pilus assembly protein Flp/PilA
MHKLQMKLTELFRSLQEREEGQTMVEYALILALVSIAAIAVLTPLGTAISGVLTDVTTAL